MRKHDLVAKFAFESKLSTTKAQRYIDTLVDIIERTVASGHKVSITGFGVFEKGKRVARHGVNPRTGEDIQIPEMATPRFRAGKNFKNLIRK